MYSRVGGLDVKRQITFMGKEQRKEDPLALFSRDLNKKFQHNNNRKNQLPKLDQSHVEKSARKLEKEVSHLKLLLDKRDKKKQEMQKDRKSDNDESFPLSTRNHLPFQLNASNVVGDSKNNLYNIPLTLGYSFNGSTTPQLIPLSINRGLNQPVFRIVNPIPQPQINSNEERVAQPKQQKSEKKTKNMKSIPQFDNKKNKNRFRICAYAVYFTIYLRHFSKKFTQNRKNWFEQRYLNDKGNVIQEGSVQILKELYDIDLIRMIEDGKERALEYDEEAKSISKDKKKCEYIGGMANFIDILLEFLTDMMTSQKFIDESHQIISIGVLNQSFMLNNLYIPPQADILHVHPKGYIVIDEETQIMMLMIKIIVKIVIFNFLLGLKHSRQWNSKQEDKHDLDDDGLDQVWKVIRIASVILIITCQQIYDKTKQKITHACNFHERAPLFGVYPTKPLEEEYHKGVSKQTGKKRSKFIINLQSYEEGLQLIAKYPYLRSFKEKLKIKIVDFLTEVYTCLKYEQNFVYDFISYMTVEENFIIFKGKQEESKKKKKKKKRGNGKSNLSQLSQIDQSQSVRLDNGSRLDNSNRLNNSNRLDNSNILDRSNRLDRSSIHSQAVQQSDQESDEDEEGNGRKKRKMKYKVEQVFYDKKFSGFSKLEGLKKKMKYLKAHKV